MFFFNDMDKISLLLVIFTTLIYWCISKQRRRPNEPPLSFGLPYIGEGLSLLVDFIGLAGRLREKYGSIVTIIVFGYRMHFVTGHKEIRKMYSMSDLFTFRDISFNFEVMFSGMESHEEMKRYTEELQPELLQGNNAMNELAVRFRNALHETIRENSELREKDYQTIDLMDFLSNLIFDVSGRSLFGETWLKGVDKNEASNQFKSFISHVFMIIIGVPKLFIQKGYIARDYIAKEIFLPQVKDDMKRAHPFFFNVVKNLKKLYNGKADGDHKVASRLVGYSLAINTNTTNTIFWSLVQIYLGDDQLRNDLKKEIKDAKPLTSSSYMDAKRKMPLMNSIILETFRLSSFSSSMRVVERDCDALGYAWRKGDFVMMLPFYEQFKSLNDDTFDGRRWMKYTTNSDFNHKLIPLPQDEHLIVFGGGKHLCPGRFFAILEIHLTISFLLENYDIQLEKGSVLPSSILSVAAIKEPSQKFPVRIRYNATC